MALPRKPAPQTGANTQTAKAIIQKAKAKADAEAKMILQRAKAVASERSKAMLERARGRLPTIKCEYQLRVSIEKGDIAALRGGISQAVDVEGLDKGLFAEACQALVEKCQEQLRLCTEGTDVEALQKKHQASRGGSGFATKDMGWRREQLGNKLRCATD